MKARDVMTAEPACCVPTDTIQQAATLMVERDCGCIPVVENLQTKKIVGTLTDRDIACRCTAAGKGADALVTEAMSTSPSCCRPDDDIRDIERVMTERRVRRVPVVDENGCCVGIVAQADLARAARRGVTDQEVGRVVERVSEPTGQPRADRSQAR
jgi:CBS domain-containing protein